MFSSRSSPFLFQRSCLTNSGARRFLVAVQPISNLVCQHQKRSFCSATHRVLVNRSKTSSFQAFSSSSCFASHNNNITTNTCAMSSAQQLTFDVLSRQDDVTSGLVLKLLASNDKFKALSSKEGNDLISRDNEDEEKLAKGVQISVKKGVLKSHPDVAPIQKINVLGKSADQVADEICSKLPHSQASVLVIQGLSGTGKGTTVAKLKDRLPKCVCWSNGNVFRTVTHLVNQSLKPGQEFSTELITPDLIKGIFGRLSFKRFGDQFDVVIDETIRVSAIANTTLKEPAVSQRVPTIAEQTQGEVVVFAAQAIDILRSNGHNVILEGRAQTLNHIPTPYRFELVIPDVQILGSRRAAQRVMAAALEKLKKHAPSSSASSSAAVSQEEVEKACVEAAETLN